MTSKQAGAERIHGFAPVIGARPRVLILGSVPSVRSLEQQQYYGNPQNSFWRIMAELFQFDPALPYAQRVQIVAEQGVVIWDVLASCVRPGSLDSAIQSTTEVVNDFPGIFAAHPELTQVFFNGRKAEDVFRKKVLAVVAAAHPRIDYACLPSTSPAMASLSFSEKLQVWRVIGASH